MAGRLPAVLVSGGPADGGQGLYLERVSIQELIRAMASTPVPAAVDLDSIEGLESDVAAARFCVRRLRAAAIVTHSMPAALAGLESGALAFLRVHALDSIGLAHALDSVPAGTGVGCALVPGPVLLHLTSTERSRLPAPILARGLIATVGEATRCLEAGADHAVLDRRHRPRYNSPKGSTGR